LGQLVLDPGGDRHHAPPAAPATAARLAT
jgi:hypothetical protein